MPLTKVQAYWRAPRSTQGTRRAAIVRMYAGADGLTASGLGSRHYDPPRRTLEQAHATQASALVVRLQQNRQRVADGARTCIGLMRCDAARNAVNGECDRRST